MLLLRPFEPVDDDVLIRWFPSAETLAAFAGPGPRWPLDPAQLAARRADPEVTAWTAVEAPDPPDGDLSALPPIGHAELMRASATAGWLDRVVIAPEERGRGLSAPLVRAVLAEARLRGMTSLDLLVYAGNEPARRSYASVGFVDRGSLPEFPEVLRMSVAL